MTNWLCRAEKSHRIRFEIWVLRAGDTTINEKDEVLMLLHFGPWISFHIFLSIYLTLSQTIFLDPLARG